MEQNGPKNLQQNGTVVPQRNMRPLTVSEIHSDTEKHMRDHFDEDIKLNLEIHCISP